MLQHLAEFFKLLVLIAKQRHHALIRLLTGQAVFRVERDGAAAQIVQVDHLTQTGARLHTASPGRRQRGCGAQTQVGLDFSHGQLDRTVTKNLQHQGTIELDVALHQRRSSGHLTQQLQHLGRVTTSAFPAFQNFAPSVIESDQHAAYRQAIENKFMKFRHSY